MATDVLMPKLGLTMTEGTVNQWFKHEGDQVQAGEPLVEITTDKTVNEIEAPASGTVGRILVTEGVTVPVLTLLCRIYAPGEAISEDSVPNKVEKGPGDSASAIPADGGSIATPRARKLAKERGIDLSSIKGTGPGGRITAADVERQQWCAAAGPSMASAGATSREIGGASEASPGPIPATPADESVAFTGVRRVIAERMSRSAREKPHVTLHSMVNMEEVIKLRARLNSRGERNDRPEVSLNDILIKFAALALKRHPEVNAHVEDGRLIKRGEVNIGLAVDAPAGLVVPVVRGADKSSISEIAGKTRLLVRRARENQLGPEDVESGTFTITNLGMFGVSEFTPIINPPECAILGVGRIEKTPVVVEDAIAVKPMATLSLSFDHRGIDGAQGARFLQTLKDFIEDPLSVLGE